MKSKVHSGVAVFLFSIMLVCISCGSNENSLSNDSYRGVVLYPSDISSLGAEKLVNILKESNINLLGIHSNTLTEDLDSLKIFLDSSEGKLLVDLCEKNSIDIEYECHVLQEILPRSLFENHPEYFRVDSNNIRTNDLNMCFSSDEAWFVIEENVTELLNWIKPTTNRYFFWIDDSYDGFCNCDECKSYSPSDQALIYENKMLSIIRNINSEAKLAHLAYASTLDAPTIIKPNEGVFLEFAPIGRNYKDSLSYKEYKALEENLELFPKNTAHVLEYWLDVSMFSGWDRDRWSKVLWEYDYFNRDIEMYRSLGINSFTTFATWMIHQYYLDTYGNDETMKILKEYGTLIKEDTRHKTNL